MKAKAPKTYTLPQVGKLLGVSNNTVYNYVNVGLIRVTPGEVAGRPGRVGRMVTEAEYLRLKRDGVDPTGLKAKLAKLGAAAKKRGSKRAAADAPAKKSVKKSAAAKTTAKKQVKRAAAGTTAKKSVKRAAAAPRAVTKKSKKR